MANGTPPGRTIRSASNEAAAKTESTKARTIQSASNEGTMKADRHAASQPHDQAARPFNGKAAQAGRDVVKAAMDQSAQQFGAGAEATSRAAQDLTRHADQNRTRTMKFGTVLVSSYGAMCSEMVKHMHQAAQRQGEMLNGMLRARSPSDLMLTGNRYFLGGLQAFFDTSARIAQASAHTAEDADRKRTRRAA